MEYKWVAMIGIIIASLMGSINMSIVMIALPAIFNGIHINPLNSFQYLLWILMGYGLVTATLLLSFGRLSDMYWRVKMFQLGFLIFSIGSILLYITPSTGDMGALEIIFFRLIQAVGAAFFMANSAAILTDAFPSNERGKALGINTVAVMAGMFLGLVVGGVLAVFDWSMYSWSVYHSVFLELYGPIINLRKYLLKLKKRKLICLVTLHFF